MRAFGLALLIRIALPALGFLLCLALGALGFALLLVGFASPALGLLLLPLHALGLGRGLLALELALRILAGLPIALVLAVALLLFVALAFGALLLLGGLLLALGFALLLLRGTLRLAGGLLLALRAALLAIDFASLLVCCALLFVGGLLLLALRVALLAFQLAPLLVGAAVVAAAAALRFGGSRQAGRRRCRVVATRAFARTLARAALAAQVRSRFADHLHLGRGRAAAHARELVARDRLAGIALPRLAALLERHVGAGIRYAASHHAAVEHVLVDGRARGGGAAREAVLHGRHIGERGHLRRRGEVLPGLHARAVRIAAVHERIAVHHRHRIAIAVLVAHAVVAHAAAAVTAPRVVRDAVVDPAVLVHAVEVALARAIARHVDVARAEREPADPAAVAAATADERDERRRVRRARALRRRQPRPARVDAHPAAVVERREAPRCVVHPGPAPRVLPDPAAVAIRRPAGGDARIPERAVLRVVRPAAVIVEVGVADHVVGHVAARERALLAAIALLDEAIEGIGRRRIEEVVTAQARVLETHGVAFAQRKARALAVDVGRAAPRDDLRPRAAVVDVDAEIAGRAHHERERRRRDLVALSLPHASHVHVQRALRELHLHVAIVEREDLDAGVLVGAQRGAAELQLGACASRDPDAVARDLRAVELHAIPPVLAGRREAHVAFRVGEAADPAGRIDGRGRERRGCGDEQGDEREAQGHGRLQAKGPGVAVQWIRSRAAAS